MIRVTRDDDPWWPASPLVLGNRVYHWTCFQGVIEDIVLAPRLLHIVIQCNDAPLVVKETRMSYRSFEFSAGTKVNVFGLGELAVSNFYYYCAISCCETGRFYQLSGWLCHIKPVPNRQHFGFRTDRELRDAIRAYFNAVNEVCFRFAGIRGSALEQEAANQARQSLYLYETG